MKLSDRDLKLLVILLLAVVIACPILFVLRPYNTKIEETEATIAQLKERQDFILKLDANRQFYLDSIALLDNERNAIIADYAEGLRDEKTVMFLANTEKQIPIGMTTLSYAEETEPTVISEATVNENGETVDGLSALTSITTVAYTAQYEEVKQLLDLIRKSDKRMVITAFSADQDDMNGAIKGTFILNQYAVTGEGRELAPAKIPSMNHGVENIFGEPEGIDPEELEEALADQEAGDGEGQEE